MELHFDHSKYLGVLLDDKMNWQYHIASVCARVAQSTGIFYKLRHFLTPTQLRQIYHTLIYPHISYAIVAWGSAYKTHVNKLQVKQNHFARVVFFKYGFDQQGWYGMFVACGIWCLADVSSVSPSSVVPPSAPTKG